MLEAIDREGWLAVVGWAAGVVGFWVVMAFALAGCLVEGPKKPEPSLNPLMPSAALLSEPEGITGSKACVLTPADPVEQPICHYVCPNGKTFELPGPVCARVAGYPKK
jgi:hypothetical protein